MRSDLFIFVILTEDVVAVRLEGVISSDSDDTYDENETIVVVFLAVAAVDDVNKLCDW
jgi:hypothetical protein